MKSIRNAIGGLLTGLFVGATPVLLARYSYPRHGAPSSPAPENSAIYPVNEHGSLLYLTAAQVREEHVYSTISWSLIAALFAAAMVMPKSNFEHRAKWYAFRASWGLDDPLHIFKIFVAVGAGIGAWWTFVQLARAVAG